MYDESLREQAFEKPVCMEGLDAMYVAGGTDTVVEPAETESADVDGGGGRTKDHDEAKKIFHVPTRRHGDVFGIDAVPWNRNLRNVVKEVLYQDLQGCHGAEREPARGNEDAEDISEVGRSDHFDVLDAV